MFLFKHVYKNDLNVWIELWSNPGYEWNTYVRLESRSRKALEKQCLFRGSLCFQLVVFVSSKRLYDIHITWFEWFLCREGDSTLHYKKIY